MSSPNPRRIEDPEVQLLAQIASTVRADYDEQSLAWEGSPFAWIRTRPSRQRGKIGEQLLAGWLAAKDFDVVRSGVSDADRVVNGVAVEMKFSTLWQNGTYRFQQIRDQDYNVLICLGISPFDAHAWVFHKDFILENWGVLPDFGSQHTGEEGSDTAWIQAHPNNPHPWITEHGGRLRDALRILQDMLPDNE